MRVCAVHRPAAGIHQFWKAVGHGHSAARTGRAAARAHRALPGLSRRHRLHGDAAGRLPPRGRRGGGLLALQPFPDNGIDWHVSHSAPGHTVDDEVTIKVQLKATYQLAPNPPARRPPPPSTERGAPPPRHTGRFFSFTLDNDHLAKLARTPVSVHKILVVMIVPRSQDQWLRAGHDRLDLRHCCYWTNLAGHPITGRRRTTVRIPTARIFDDRALCEIMTRVGTGGKP